jgi:hypothetical protein
MNRWRLTPGEQLVFEREGRRVAGVVHQRSPSSVTRSGPTVRRSRTEADGSAGRTWTAKAYRLPVETRVDTVAGHLEDSLFASVERLGEGPSDRKVRRPVRVGLRLRGGCPPGDEFGCSWRSACRREFVGYGDISAEYRSADRLTLSAVRFPTETGHRGTTTSRPATGRSSSAPRWSSPASPGLSHARRHPSSAVSGPSRHRLRRPIGQPCAVADGVVAAAGWAGGYGLSVTVTTPGIRDHVQPPFQDAGPPRRCVRQRDVIGHPRRYRTATGPHRLPVAQERPGD